MYVFINKQSKSFKFASAFYIGFARKTVQRRFLISKVSAGKINTESVARGLQVEQAWPRP